MSKRFAALGLAAALFRLSMGEAYGHEYYNKLRESYDQTTGRLCCGGDPQTGDCEAVAYQILPNGDAIFFTSRYGQRKVLIAKERIFWMAVPGGEANEAHWCGKPRSAFPSAGAALPVDAEQPDPEVWTYCAFIAPGGV
jgi:hypothetical protein